MNTKHNHSLKAYNTFGIEAIADTVHFLTDPEQLQSIEGLSSCLFLGGGSNVLFTSDIHRTVIVNQTLGISPKAETDHTIQLEVASGENWHDLVMYCVQKGYGGIENLSLIPGSVGAAPMQNIGAYGVEVKDVIDYVKAIDLETKEEVSFSKEECKFGYRESIFKNVAKNAFFISAIGITLTKKDHKINTQYGAIQEVLQRNRIAEPSILDVSQAVIEIRQSKLPDPKDLGNSGSFFKNPVISIEEFERVKRDFPHVKSYVVDDNHIKLPAGWLIEQAGWKGKRIGNTGSHKNQALVLVNYGEATGSEIHQLSQDIQQSVIEKFGVSLETEVNII